jgi:hypothetical protein
MKIKRITAPMFKVIGILINEYELRQLMVDVKKGIVPANIKVTDAAGNESLINEHGFLTNDLNGLDLVSNLTIALLTLNK